MEMDRDEALREAAQRELEEIRRGQEAEREELSRVEERDDPKNPAVLATDRRPDMATPNNTDLIAGATTTIDRMMGSLKEKASASPFDCRLILKLRFDVGDHPPTDPAGAVRWMNSKHFVVQDVGKVIVVTEGVDPELDRKVLHRSSVADIKHLYANRSVNTQVKKGEPKEVPLMDFWMRSPSRRTFQGIVCLPDKQVSGFYNLWQGFSVEPKSGDWSLMERHIREVICATDEESYRYVRKWMAFAVQRPGTLPETALVLHGKQGTGKGVFARGFGQLFGQHFLHLKSARNLVGNFNAHLRDAVLVFADEAYLVGDKQSEGVLKAMITEPELTIERKFHDVGKCSNLIHLIIASNNEQIINAAAEERRFCVLNVSDARQQDHDYFAAILQQMDDGGRAAMLHDLQREGLSRFDIRKIPATVGLRDQKLLSMQPHERWWFERLQHGRLLDQHSEWQREVIKDELLVGHQAATKEFKISAQELRAMLSKVLPDGYPQQGSRSTVGGERKRTWLLPSLEDCRAHFEKMFRLADPWEDAE